MFARHILERPGGMRVINTPKGFSFAKGRGFEDFKNTVCVYIIQFQAASSSQGNEELASCYLPHTGRQSKYLTDERSEINREQHPWGEQL